jgi:hypothetical protein
MCMAASFVECSTTALFNFSYWIPSLQWLCLVLRFTGSCAAAHGMQMQMQSTGLLSLHTLPEAALNCDTRAVARAGLP